MPEIVEMNCWNCLGQKKRLNRDGVLEKCCRCEGTGRVRMREEGMILRLEQPAWRIGFVYGYFRKWHDPARVNWRDQDREERERRWARGRRATP